MKNLSNEVKLDIFKYLNFNQLNVIQQTNKSFCGIVDRYKTELARKEVFALEIDWKYYVCKQVKCPSKSLHFQLNPDTKAKWNDALKQQIPLFISQPKEIHQHRFDEAVNLFLFLDKIYESPGSSDGRASERGELLNFLTIF
ncbi:unnamed protein product [Meloidogyne enterolobii]|uniref:Uncharacterized protein n=1 Tax=Meloidogyne enterolobii TaxID=390850 RepID=A0ACB0YUN4_MELEN